MRKRRAKMRREAHAAVELLQVQSKDKDEEDREQRRRDYDEMAVRYGLQRGNLSDAELRVKIREKILEMVKV